MALELAVAVAANSFLSAEQDEGEMYGPLPPKIPTKEQISERNKEQLARWQAHCVSDVKRRTSDPDRRNIHIIPYHPLLGTASAVDPVVGCAPRLRIDQNP